jgi:spoIIIJ-associated protein
MQTKREIESSGSDVQEAIVAGLELLGVERDAVEIDVLDEGSRGLLGIGARPARVRLTLQAVEAVEQQPPPPAPAPQAATDVRREPRPARVEEAPAESGDEEVELRRFAPVARQTLEELLEKMGIQARVEDYVKPAQDEEDYPKLVLNVQGRDLGILIGRRGETLSALQYLTRLIVGREVERRVNLIVDVEGYRVRRERSLCQLAQRMAERVVATGRRQVLEPMSPAERRIVHVALRNHADVMTESIGQGESRKVTIFLRGSK